MEYFFFNGDVILLNVLSYINAGTLEINIVFYKLHSI